MYLFAHIYLVADLVRNGCMYNCSKYAPTRQKMGRERAIIDELPTTSK